MGIASALLLASISFHLPEGLLSAVCFVESSHRAYAIHVQDGHHDSLGACQVQEPTARMMGYKGSRERLHRNVNTNTFYAAAYLRYQLDRYDQDWAKAVAAYNAGTYYQSKAGHCVNHRYVERVRRAWAAKR